MFRQSAKNISPSSTTSVTLGWYLFREDDASADSEGTDTLKKPSRQSPAYSNVEMEKGLSRREKNR